MARIDWSVLCDLANIDRHERLCVLGVTRQLSVPTLPHTIEQMSMVAHLADLRLVDEVALSFRLWSPDGAQASAERVGVHIHGEYAVATLQGIALSGEGTYFFELSVNGDARAIGVPLVAFDRPGNGLLH